MFNLPFKPGDRVVYVDSGVQGTIKECTALDFCVVWYDDALNVDVEHPANLKLLEA